MRLKFAAITTLVAALFVSSRAFGLPIYTIEQALASSPRRTIPKSQLRGRNKARTVAGWKLARDTFRG